MAFKLTEKDHRQMDKHIELVLAAHSSEQITTKQAVATLAHLLTAGVIDNEGEFKRYIELDAADIFSN